MSMYGQFKTNKEAETKGVVLDYGDYRVTIARAGGSNKRFAKSVEEKTKPYKRAIETDTIKPEKYIDIIHEVYAEAVILNWEVLHKGEWKSGIEGENGEVLPVTKENIIKVFKELPDLFDNIKADAMSISLFREKLRESDAGN